MEEFQVFISCAITLSSLTVLVHPLPAMDIVPGKVLLLPQKKKRLMHDRAYESFRHVWIINKGSTITLKATPFFCIWILCTVITKLAAWVNMHSWRSVIRSLHTYEIVNLLSNCFDMEGFSSDIGREVQCYPYGEIKLLFVYSLFISLKQRYE